MLDALEQKGELEMEEDLEADADELAGDVEYVSDIESQSEAEDGDLEDWMASEDGDGSESDVDITQQSRGGDGPGDTDQLQKAIQSLKRKRPLSETPRDKRLKGPKQQVVYETEEERKRLADSIAGLTCGSISLYL